MYDFSPVHLSGSEIVPDPTEKGRREGKCVSRRKTKHSGNEARFRSCPKGKAMDAGSNWRQEMFLNRFKKREKSLEMEKRTKEYKHLYCWPERILGSTLSSSHWRPPFLFYSVITTLSRLKYLKGTPRKSQILKWFKIFLLDKADLSLYAFFFLTTLTVLNPQK